MGAFKSAFATIYKSIRSVVASLGLPVGGTADFPRVELHSFTENEPLDKGLSLRQVTLTIEADSVNSIGEAVTMIDTSLSSLIGVQLGLDDTAFEVVGVLPQQRQEITENIDSKSILYRLLQTIIVYIQIKA